MSLITDLDEKTIESQFQQIHDSLIHLPPELDYDKIIDAIAALANTLADTDTNENTWCTGEHGLFTLDDLVVGAYWHLSEWHEGQSSATYAALCAVGRIFHPGMATAETDLEPYKTLNDLAEASQ